MDFIIDKVIGYLNKAICKYAQEKNIINPNDVQILFYLKPDNNGNYGYAAVKMCEHYKAKEETTFKKAMGVKLDLLNLAGATEFFVQSSLIDFCELHKISPSNVSVMIVRKDDDDMVMHLYNGTQHVRKLNPEEIFNQEKLKTA